MRWASVALLIGVCAALMAELLRPPARAEAQVSTATSAGKVLAVAGQITSGSYGIYLVDLETRIMTVYEWLPRSRKLRLLAARNTSYDLQLDEYNTSPSPGEIKKLVSRSQRLADTEPR